MHGQALRPVPGKTVVLKGIAYAGARGVTRVEVSCFDNAQAWHEARIDYKGAPMAWVLWSYDWQPTQRKNTLWSCVPPMAQASCKRLIIGALRLKGPPATT